MKQLQNSRQGYVPPPPLPPPPLHFFTSQFPLAGTSSQGVLTPGDPRALRIRIAGQISVVLEVTMNIPELEAGFCSALMQVMNAVSNGTYVASPEVTLVFRHLERFCATYRS